jgi:choline/glycine/proline betaine transport protein
MFKRFVINPPVFFGSLIVIFLFLAIGVLFPSGAEEIFRRLQVGILNQFGWLYLLSVGIFLLAVLLLCLGRFGRLRLGPDDSTPDFSFVSWVAMLFAAGMGIGLMFYAVGEPMSHYMAPPTAEPRTVAAVREAMAVTFFHWGIHAWAIYAVVGLSLAYFGFRYNLPLTIRSGLYPLLKERINGPIGHAVDIFAIVGTMFGLATSLGVGASQINAGFNYLLGWPIGPEVQLPIIAVVTAFATISVVSGLDKGVRILSETNLVVAILLMIFVLVVGPTSELLRDFVQNLGLYLDGLVLRTFNIYAYQPTPWIDAWTLFYWAWWISWSPFVGMFIAKISRGRTVREFITAVLFIPAGFTFIWMTVFGNTAIWIDSGAAAGQLGTAVAADISVGLFQFFQYLPFPVVTSTLAVILVAIFFCDVLRLGVTGDGLDCGRGRKRNHDGPAHLLVCAGRRCCRGPAARGRFGRIAVRHHRQRSAVLPGDARARLVALSGHAGRSGAAAVPHRRRQGAGLSRRRAHLAATSRVDAAGAHRNAGAGVYWHHSAARFGTGRRRIERPRSAKPGR